MTAGHFREDLYYRLNVIGVQVPPLRERREDIPALVNHLIHWHNMEMRIGYRRADNAAMKVLLSLPWRGNVRELDNALERAIILGNGEWITPKHLPIEKQGVIPLAPLLAEGDHLKAALRAYEQSHIEYVLKKTEGDRTRLRGTREVLIDSGPGLMNGFLTLWIGPKPVSENIKRLLLHRP